MEALFEILVPLLIIAVIVIINILARIKETQEKDERERTGEPATKARLATPDQIRKFLEEAGRTGARRQGEQAPEAPPQRQTRYGAPAGMPAGSVTPAEQARRSEDTRRRQRTQRTPPPPPQTKRVPLEQRRRESKLATRTGRSEKRKFESSFERRSREQEAAKPKRGAPGIRATAIGTGKKARPGIASKDKTDATLLPKFNRRSLRRAIVMSEILGSPVALKQPGQ